MVRSALICHWITGPLKQLINNSAGALELERAGGRTESNNRQSLEQRKDRN